MTDEEKMRLALSEARKAFESGEVPVGAVLFHGDDVIASAHNLCRQLNDSTAHAELLAIREGVKIFGLLSQCELFVTLEPCAMCAGAVVNAQVGRVVYGAFDEKEGCCGSLIDLTDHWLSHSCPTVGGILEKECSALLTSFFENKH